MLRLRGGGEAEVLGVKQPEAPANVLVGVCGWMPPQTGSMVFDKHL